MRSDTATDYAAAARAVRRGETIVVFGRRYVLDEPSFSAVGGGPEVPPKTDLPDGTGPDWRIFGHGAVEWLTFVRAALKQSTRPGAVYRGGEVHVTPPTGPLWLLILLEAVFDAVVETDRRKLRAGLMRVASTAADWIEAIDRRTDRVAEGDTDGT